MAGGEMGPQTPGGNACFCLIPQPAAEHSPVDWGQGQGLSRLLS